jgi:hypothetical protein
MFEPAIVANGVTRLRASTGKRNRGDRADVAPRPGLGGAIRPPAIRTMIYAANTVESLIRSVRKVIKARASFASDLRWTLAIAWPEGKPQFMILFAR